MSEQIVFAHKELFWLLSIIPLLIAWYVFKQVRKQTQVTYSTASFLPKTQSVKPVLRHVMFAFQMIAIGLLITAMARPQSSTSSQKVSTKGIDIVLAMDISGSMRAKDFDPNRLEAARGLALDFVEGRKTDRIGLVVFAGQAFTQCPLTTDHSVLKNLFQDIEFGMIEDGTAMGSGLATAVNRLNESKAKSKVVILLTDGVNNSGNIPPLTAAEIAETYGIKVYTIGVGTNGKAPMPVQTITGQTVFQKTDVYIDEETLTQVAEQTGGKYFRATDNESLKKIYTKIDELEKTEIEVKEYRKRKEEFYPYAAASGILLILSFLVQHTTLKSIV